MRGSTDGTARLVREAGFPGCVELVHTSTRVVLEPNIGGRVLRYTLDSVEAMHTEPSQDGMVWTPGCGLRHPAGGRFDAGPEYGGPARTETWLGGWTAEVTGPCAARLTSAVAVGSGLQIVREFELRAGSHLRCTQIIQNRGTAPLPTFHWSRTFVPGGGVALAPLPPIGRFPRGYALGGPAGVVDFLPAPDPRISVSEGILQVMGPPRQAKFLLDVEQGWLGYLNAAGLLFLKLFPVDRRQPSGELAGNNASLWYGGTDNTPAWPLSTAVAEIEALGPAEVLAPGGSCRFTEHWFLQPAPHPPLALDLSWVRRVAAERAAELTG